MVIAVICGVICAIVILAYIVPYYSQSAVSDQKVTSPSATPLSPFTLTLTTSTPTVDIPVHNQDTHFQITLSKNSEENLQFPCTVSIYSTPQNNFGSSLNLIGYQTASNYGTNQYTMSAYTASLSGFEGKNMSFYAEIKDAYGVTVDSNSIQIEYYGNGLSPNNSG